MINIFDGAVTKLLDGASSAATGDDASTPHIYHSFQLLATAGSPSTVTLEGSLNGVNYASLGTLNTNNDILRVVGTFWTVRARVSSYTGGDSVTVLYRGTN